MKKKNLPTAVLLMLLASNIFAANYLFNDDQVGNNKVANKDLEVVTTYLEDFSLEVNMDLWAPYDGTHPDGTPIFTVSQNDNALMVDMRQRDFFDGQMYNFVDVQSIVFDLMETPLLSMRIKIDPTETDYRVWNWGTNEAVPATDIPYGVSVWSNGEKISGQVINVPIDGEWHDLVYTFAGIDLDLSSIEWILIETVTWRPDFQQYEGRDYFNKALYWMDDFKVGEAVDVVPVTSITITSPDDVTEISETGQTLQLSAVVEPAEATIGGVDWKVLPGTGYGKISATGLFTPVSDGTAKVVALARDGSGVSDTLELTLTNQTQVVDTYSENFTSAVDMYLWRPYTGTHPDGTPIFAVSQDDDALLVDMRQRDFFDGQMYNFKKAAGNIFDLTDAPLLSMRIKIDPTETDYRVWNWGTNEAVPATDIPYGVSVWSNGEKISGQVINVPIDGEWHDLVYTFAGIDVDISSIEWILIESVTWRPDFQQYEGREYFNKAVYWMDNFRIGEAVAVTPVTTITITTPDDVTEISETGQTLQMTAVIEPAEATIGSVDWKVLPGTGYGKINTTGLFTPVSDGTAKVVALAKDGSGISDTLELTLTNQTQVVDTYSENFTSAVDMYLWHPFTGTHPNGTPVFTVSQDDDALLVDMRQRDFFDGQMYNFKKAAGKIFDLADAPLFSMRIKIDPTETDYREWNWGTNEAVPATHIPYGVSAWSNDEKVSGQVINVPIDGEWHDLYFSFADADIDLSMVEWILIETVTWRPDFQQYEGRDYFNKALYWMDNVRIGEAVNIPELVTAIVVKGENDLTAIDTFEGTLQMLAEISPAEPTIGGVVWGVNDETKATITQTGLLTAVGDGTVTVTAHAKDGSGISGSTDIAISGQTQVVTYALTVISGTGSGEYEEGTVVDITADAAPEGKQFAQWTGDVDNVADVNSASTTITMPASAITVTATYEDISVTEDLVLNVRMSVWSDYYEKFDPETDFVDVAGTFNNWEGTQLTAVDDPEDDYLTYTVTIEALEIGVEYGFKFRINGVWDDGTAEFPFNGPERKVTIAEGENVYTFWYNDEDETTSVDELSSVGFSVFPNPASQTIIIGGSLSNLKEIRLIDVTGKIVLQKTVDSNNVTINIDHLEEGLYVIQAITENQLHSQKLYVKK